MASTSWKARGTNRTRVRSRWPRMRLWPPMTTIMKLCLRLADLHGECSWAGRFGECLPRMAKRELPRCRTLISTAWSVAPLSGAGPASNQDFSQFAGSWYTTNLTELVGSQSPHYPDGEAVCQDGLGSDANRTGIQRSALLQLRWRYGRTRHDDLRQRSRADHIGTAGHRPGWPAGLCLEETQVNFPYGVSLHWKRDVRVRAVHRTFRSPMPATGRLFELAIARASVFAPWRGSRWPAPFPWCQCSLVQHCSSCCQDGQVQPSNQAHSTPSSTGQQAARAGEGSIGRWKSGQPF